MLKDNGGNGYQASLTVDSCIASSSFNGCLTVGAFC